MKLCQQCGKPTVAPVAAGPAPGKVDDLVRRLKENESHGTEITGYVDQLSISTASLTASPSDVEQAKKELTVEMGRHSKVARSLVKLTLLQFELVHCIT